MDEPHWSLRSRRTLHRGFVTLTEHEVELPTGETVSYEVDESVSAGVAVLGITQDGSMRLAREYRYPLDRWIYDLPGGGVESGEDPVDAARREYEEEIGLRPVDLAHLLTFSQNPARLAYPTHLYFCTRTTPGTKTTDDPQEVVRSVDMSIRDFDQLVGRGEIVDPCLLIARLVAAQKGLLPAVGV